MTKRIVALSALLLAGVSVPVLARGFAELKLTAQVRFVEDLGSGSCLGRLVIGPRPEDILDTQASGRVCAELTAATGKVVTVTGHCSPVFTVYGSLCRPVIERVVRVQRKNDGLE